MFAGIGIGRDIDYFDERVPYAIEPAGWNIQPPPAP